MYRSVTVFDLSVWSLRSCNWRVKSSQVIFISQLCKTSWKTI